MTLYYSLVFGLLSAEIVTFLVLVAPMPFAFKQKFFKFLSTNPLVAKLQYSLKISLIFTSILFFDAVQRMLRVVKEGQTAKEEHAFTDVRSETNFAARKFYSQRNVYLTGFTLFLSLILSRVFGIIMDLIQSQEELGLMKKDGQSSAAQNFKKQIEAKDREIAFPEILKKQSTQNNKAMNELVDNANSSSGSKKEK
ncbi:B-cell receptor-associated 31-like protein [Wallemia mellicola]|uniref:Endoplasmic reticulum transmembrane protein n=1 Tax=Wallemia mellicola TaxID=1708541 RepID=A0A4T0UCI1_9BASI|nr:B-cell receptor-associated 31-like protein [Wallemia mellicola]TIC11972.1 B-cell receptor-associated 31-like protein [Wallemia mellicola]TIC14157.1 B-cell receptor-associated 31-like protein [Wallemia mellicola]TIC32747.1 B-cell receptor-associated 31-like protein [Wallemia mellicola]TIC55841.1 B-cell receptor-associated 31-like protein [Wallemia mellicola]